MNTSTIDSRALEGATAVLIPAECLVRFGPLIRDLNGRGVPWGLYRPGASSDGSLKRAAQRLGTQASQCLIVTGETRIATGTTARRRPGSILEAVLERFRERGLACLSRTLEAWAL